jgi:hypothetical protein
MQTNRGIRHPQIPPQPGPRFQVSGSPNPSHLWMSSSRALSLARDIVPVISLVLIDMLVKNAIHFSHHMAIWAHSINVKCGGWIVRVRSKTMISTDIRNVRSRQMIINLCKGYIGRCRLRGSPDVGRCPLLTSPRCQIQVAV